MRRLLYVALVAALLAPFAALCHDVLAEDDDLTRAVRALAGENAADRASARDQVMTIGESALPDLLRLVEDLVVGHQSEITVPTEVSARRAPAAEPEPTVQLYDVKDLMSDEFGVEDLVRQLRDDEEAGRAGLEGLEPSTLIVKGAAGSHSAIRAILDRLRMGQMDTLLIESRFVTVASSVDLGVGLARARPGNIVLDEDVVENVLEWARGGAAQVLAAPSMTVNTHQRAEVTVGRQVSYVADFEFEIGSQTGPPDPIIDTVFVGSSIGVVGTIVGDRLRLDLDVRESALQEPMATFKTTLANGPEIEIQLPEIFERRVTRGIGMDDGGTVLISLGRDGDTHRLLVLSARRVVAAEKSRPR